VQLHRHRDGAVMSAPDRHRPREPFAPFLQECPLLPWIPCAPAIRSNAPARLCRSLRSRHPRNMAYPCGMTDHAHHHPHDHSELSETELRVRALETVLTEKGYVDPAALDLLIETYETKVGPRNGARVVARAWSDPAYRARLLRDA